MRYQSKKLVSRVDTRVKNKITLYTRLIAREGKIKIEEKWNIQTDSIVCMTYTNDKYIKTTSFTEEEAIKYQKEFEDSLIEDKFEYEILGRVEIIHYECENKNLLPTEKITIRKVA